MRRWFSIATLGFLLLTVPAWAQRHGGFGGGGHISAGRGFSGGHSFAGHSFAGPSFAGHSFAGHSSSFHGGSFARSGVRIRTGTAYRRHFYGRGFYPSFYYPYGYYPYLGYGWDWDNDAYDDQPTDSYAESYAQPPYSEPSYRDDNEVRQDLENLSGKIDHLQADVEARNHPIADEQPATALVFRDQHVEEVRNYAISGGMLWVLNAQAGKKIPLTQLDLDATVKMNDDRGVDFQVPAPALQIMIVR